MYPRCIATAALLFIALPIFAQEVAWVSDKQFVPLRSGEGNEFRIVHRGLPSGTQLTINRVNEDSGYTQVTTAGGTQGWIRSQYLMRDRPAAQELTRANIRIQGLETQLATLNEELANARQDQ